MKNSIRLLFYLATLIFLVSIDKKLEAIVKLEIAQAEYMLQTAQPTGDAPVTPARWR